MRLQRPPALEHIENQIYAESGNDVLYDVPADNVTHGVHGTVKQLKHLGEYVDRKYNEDDTTARIARRKKNGDERDRSSSVILNIEIHTEIPRASEFGEVPIDDAGDADTQ
jgi:hypothetical protein